MVQQIICYHYFIFLKKKKIGFFIIIQKKAFISEKSKFNYLKITQRYKIENYFQKILKKKPSHIILSATGDYNERKLILLAKEKIQIRKFSKILIT